MLSRTKKTRGIPSAAVERESTRTQPAAAAEPATAQRSSVPDVFTPSSGGHHREGAASPSRAASRRALKNWRVRSRLFLLVIIPTIAAVVLGGIRISSAVQSALVYQRVLQMANLSGKITGLASALQRERNDTVQFIVLGGTTPANGSNPPAGGRGTPPSGAGSELSLLRQDYAVSSSWANQVKGLVGGIGGSYPALAQQDAEAVVTAINDLPALRQSATTTQLPALTVISKYTQAINTLLATESQVAVGSGDTTLAGSVRVLTLVSAMKEEASEQQAILTSALQSDLLSLGTFGPGEQRAIINAQAEQQGNLAEFQSAATASQQQLFNNALSGSAQAQAQAQEQQAISLANSKSAIATDPTITDASSAMSYVVGNPQKGLGSVEQQLVNSVISRSSSLRTDAITSAIIDSLVVALLLGVALVSTTIVGRSMVRPLRRLRAGALEIAGLRLPETVRRMSETDGEGVSLDVEPIDVDSSDEIGEVARAFDQVHREALRLAANEAALRGNVNAMFVNLSRRSQSLVERQIRLIDNLEQGEQDPERLSSLFQMDHLATRMRRNSENLLVLAGHDESRRWNQPLALVDVLRASLSEIEHYERVTLNVQPGIVVRGQAVSDVVHLTAELVENATSFSAAETPVSIGGHLLGSGGVLLEITDEGVGMSAEEMAHANWRLDNPPVVDVAVSRRMGLFVVARLAAKHGIRVRLRPAASGGLIALIWLPDEAIMQESPGASPAMHPTESGAERAALTSGWGDTGRASAEEEVSAARTPRFAPLRVDAAETGLGPRRVPGAGPRPGADTGWVAATGPLPAFRTVPRPASEGRHAEPAATGAPPETGVGGEQPPAPSWTAGSYQAAATYEPFGTGLHPFDTGAASASFDTGAAAASFDTAAAAFGAPATAADADVGGETHYRSPSRPDGSGTDGGSDGREPDSSQDVIVPSAEDLGEGNRLPIFEAVESDWFRRGRQAV
ncbi:MAG TPA: nitrate- and nitrite sensing domain-containing protein, partial [Streptosporangiaceae bacterium]|nr:nitrate- and nitrite sensing domain-containing protein [Streptosporangiaceae bacterium]